MKVASLLACLAATTALLTAVLFNRSSNLGPDISTTTIATARTNDNRQAAQADDLIPIASRRELPPDPAIPAPTTLNPSAEPERSMEESGQDRGLSGLTHDEKIQQIMTCDREFQNSRSAGGKSQAMAESILTTRCAIAIMRESGRAIYELDVDGAGDHGFKAPPRSPDILFTTADNAKYLIDLNEFPAVRLASERYAALRTAGEPALPELTESELAQYDQLTQQAYSALGFRPK